MTRLSWQEDIGRALVSLLINLILFDCVYSMVNPQSRTLIGLITHWFDVVR